MEHVERGIGELAAMALERFKWQARENGDRYVSLKDGSPEWLSDLVRAAHGDFLPDDWRYERIHSALESIADCDVSTQAELHELGPGWADGPVDVYTGARLEWLASHLQRPNYCDEAISELGAPLEPDIIATIGYGQYTEAREVFDSIAGSLLAQLER